MECTDSPMKLSSNQPSVSQHRPRCGHLVFSGRPGRCYGHQYSRRASSSKCDASGLCRTSIGDRKPQNHLPSESGHHASKAGDKAKSCHKPRSTRRNLSVVDSSSPNGDPPKCGICLKTLRQKSLYFLGDESASNELTVVAVLVCGHIYHACCLDQKTSEVDTRDPPCPSCSDEVT